MDLWAVRPIKQSDKLYKRRFNSSPGMCSIASLSDYTCDVFGSLPSQNGTTEADCGFISGLEIISLWPYYIC